MWLDVDQLREEHPGCGVEKMYYILKPDFIGRDKFIEEFMALGYRVKQIRNYHRTTIPTHIRYPNLIEGLVVSGPNMVWQSDITYFKVKDKFYYIVFIIDVYSRKIVGYQVTDHMRKEANLKAFKMAIADRQAPRIHHSDRGSQYASREYRGLLKSHGVEVSMGLIAQDNAYAERVNGVIKNEYLRKKSIQSFYQLKLELKNAVKNYNERRVHRSLPGKISPQTIEREPKKNLFLETIFARERPGPKQGSFEWNQQLDKKLLCSIIN